MSNENEKPAATVKKSHHAQAKHFCPGCKGGVLAAWRTCPMCGAALRVSGEAAAPAREKHGKTEEKRETETKPKTDKRKYSDEFYEVC